MRQKLSPFPAAAATAPRDAPTPHRAPDMAPELPVETQEMLLESLS